MLVLGVKAFFLAFAGTAQGIVKQFEGTVSVISSDPTSKDGNA